MLKTNTKILEEFSTLIPQPLHLIIEGQTRSGKTWLAQQLAKELEVHTEVWSSFGFTPFPLDYSIIPNAPVYANDVNGSVPDLPRAWQERAEYWQKNIGSEKCIVIDECPNLTTINSNSFLTRCLLDSNLENTNIILTSQGSISPPETWDNQEAEKYLNKTKVRPHLSLDDENLGLLNHNFKLKFSVIRLGWNAERYAESVLNNRDIVIQIKSARYPCLIGDKVVDLADFS